MNLATDCPSCYGTGTVPAPYDPRPGCPAHPYQDICECGVLRETHPGYVEHIGRLIAERGRGVLRNYHKLALVRAAGFAAWVDEGIAADVERLWSAGIATGSSCQSGPPDPFGHWAPSIGIKDAGDAGKAAALVPWVEAIIKPEGAAILYGRGCYRTVGKLPVHVRPGCRCPR